MKFYLKMYYLTLMIALFIGVNVLRSFGYIIGEANSTVIQLFFPSFWLMLLVFAVSPRHLKVKYFFEKANSFEGKFLIFLIFLICYSIYTHIDGVLAFISNTLLLPVFFSCFLSYLNENNIIRTKKIVIIFFIVNSLIAIIENLTSFHFFMPLIENLDYNGFRSTALQSHPLNNALITAVIMSFILVTRLRVTTKYLLFFLGFAAIISFGSRSSLIGTSLMFIIFIMSSFFKKKGSKYQNIMSFLLAITGALVTFYVLTASKLGERLMNKLYIDDSASVRFDIFQILDLMQSENFYWGSTSSYVDSILSDKLGIPVIENFWIIWIIRFGLIFGGILSCFFITFLFKLLRRYGKFDKYLIIGTFLLIASLNNSLGTNSLAITVLVICSYSFREYSITK
jgi:hypothetical protein